MSVIEKLISHLSRLPGIGKKSAARIVYYLLKTDVSYVQSLAGEMKVLREVITNCTVCGNFTEINPCDICSDASRDARTICVVEEPKDIIAIESAREYSGRYHVLMGVISPIEGIGPQELRFNELFERIEKEGIREVIIATNPTIEGETTAQYIVNKLKSSGIVLTRLASGLPVGGALEYADPVTLARAFKGRNPVEKG
jgi:recombination protein RecR